MHLTIAANPKEYFEMFEDKETIKSTKELKKVQVWLALKTSPKE